MTPPLHATFGEKDDMHALLLWEGPSQLPAVLWGLTDKPPGTLAPGERWWPAVGCGPVESWWALWWTRPDDQAKRGGMVRSEVALWPLDEIGVVDDLRPTMETLAGEDTILTPPGPMLAAAADALLSPGAKSPVLLDLGNWPGMIMMLWARLWPAARAAFSARVAISPPQGGESVAPPWIFGVPPLRAPQWTEYPRIEVPLTPQPWSRAVRWFVGYEDPTFNELLSACPSLPAGLNALGRVARAADGLERLRESSSPQHALELLRILTVLAPTSDTATALKREASLILARSLSDSGADLVLRLANLDLSRIADRLQLEDAVAAWTRRCAAKLPADEAVQLLNRLSPGQALDWWQSAIRKNLAVQLAHPEPGWARTVLYWLGQPQTRPALSELLPETEAIEQCLLDAATDDGMTADMLQSIRAQASERGWSRLHAWAAIRALVAHEALRMQRHLFGSRPGLDILSEQLPGEIVVDEALRDPEPHWISLVARRTAREPHLLSSLDPSQKAWRALWTAHLEARGIPWAPGANRHELGRGLLDAALGCDDCAFLVRTLAVDLADCALDHPQRAELWRALDPETLAILLSHVIDSVMRRCDAGRPMPTPERPLRDAFLNKLHRAPPSAQVLAMTLGWEVPLEEQYVIRWLSHPRPSEWTSVAQAIGNAVLKRNWKEMALELYRRSGYIRELRPAVEACRTLLPSWYQTIVVWFWDRSGSIGSREPLVLRVAELGADLGPDELDDLWIRAGGSRKRLKDNGSPQSRWLDAARQADQGALRDGLAALVRELRAARPHNEELAELASILSRH
ncbi:effector-associated domain EAD1-containing protein [Nannocystis sp. SCPEA4]|uniref:GAP1-N1 domain-containing protein n=1 Tax=Nannocystis sp. SCPEA4 TaxID=2996787 RepID=UPI00226E6881|nr:effector-associated domain EAD1-containing protein [Nannocystis sp. SCPEA4]